MSFCRAGSNSPTMAFPSRLSEKFFSTICRVEKRFSIFSSLICFTLSW